MLDAFNIEPVSLVYRYMGFHLLAIEAIVHIPWRCAAWTRSGNLNLVEDVD